MHNKIEETIREATKDLVGKTLDQDVLVERLTKEFLKIFPTKPLDEVQVSTEDGQRYEFSIPLDVPCGNCGAYPVVKSHHPKIVGMFVCLECGTDIH